MAEISSIALRLLQVSPDALLVVDEQGVIQFSNETSSALFGFSADQLIGQPIKSASLNLTPARSSRSSNKTEIPALCIAL